MSSHAPTRSVQELITIMAEAEAELARLTGGQVDAVLDPATARPILLRSAQTRLAASEDRLRKLLARCPVLVVELQRDGTITYANEAVARVMATTSADLENVPFTEIVEITA